MFVPFSGVKVNLFVVVVRVAGEFVVVVRVAGEFVVAVRVVCKFAIVVSAVDPYLAENTIFGGDTLSRQSVITSGFNRFLCRTLRPGLLPQFVGLVEVAD